MRYTLILALFALACADEPTALTDGSQDELAFSITLEPNAEAAVLELVNTASFEVLDDDVALDRRAAQGIVDLRPLNTMEELDAVPYVGDAALDKLYGYALDNDLIESDAVVVHGIEEGSDLALDILDLVAVASEQTLDVDVALDARAAANIVAARDLAPIDSLTALDDISYVGASAFGKLADFVVASDDLDVDGDGYTGATDCNDNDDRIHPGATEKCDGVDNDCDPNTTEYGLVSTADYNTEYEWAAGNAELFICPGVYDGPLNYGDVSGTITGIGNAEDIIIRGGIVTNGYGNWQDPTLSVSNLTVQGFGIEAHEATLTVEDVIIDRPSHYGLVIRNDAVATIDNVEIRNAGGAGAWFQRGSVGVLTDTVITGSYAEGLRVHTADVSYIRGAILDNNGGGVDVHADWEQRSDFSASNTDMGVGDTSNHGFDVEITYSSSGYNLYGGYGPNASFSCSAYQYDWTPAIARCI